MQEPSPMTLWDHTALNSYHARTLTSAVGSPNKLISLCGGLHTRGYQPQRPQHRMLAGTLRPRGRPKGAKGMSGSKLGGLV